MAFNANLLLVTAFLCLLSVHHGRACFPAIFSFGDSLQDTGNFINTFANTTISKLPWGITYFHKATGRYSDGRLIIDFIGLWSHPEETRRTPLFVLVPDMV